MMMSLSSLNIGNLLESDDDTFEDAVCSMDVASLLELVGALQNSMAVEQRYFDALSLKLESIAPSTVEYEKLSTALCASQLQLAKLCTRNMRCFTQQAIRAREDPASLVNPSNHCPSNGPPHTTYLKASDVAFDYDDNLMHDFTAVERLTQDQVQNLLAASGFDSVDAQLRQMLEGQLDGQLDNGSSDEHDYDSVDDAGDNYDYFITESTLADPIKELEVIPEEDEEDFYEEPTRRKIQPLIPLKAHMRPPSPRTGSPKHDSVHSDTNSESSETNSVNTVVTEIRKGSLVGDQAEHQARARILEERAEKVRTAVEKLIRDHQPKISHSTNLLNLIKNFENIAKNNEKVLEKIRIRQNPPRRKIVSNYINETDETERSPAVNLLNPVTVSMSSRKVTAATFARESILEQSEELKPLKVQRLKMPVDLDRSGNMYNSEVARQDFSSTLGDQLRKAVSLKSSNDTNMESINRIESRLNGSIKRMAGDNSVVGAEAILENANQSLDSLANSKWSRSLSSTNLCGSEALIGLLKEMYTIDDIAENHAPPKIQGYANIVLNSKFREKFLRLEEGRLNVFEGEFTERAIQKMDLTGKCHIQLLDDRSIGVEFFSPACNMQATVVQLNSQRERDTWFSHLLDHSDISLNFVVPVNRPLTSHKKCIVIDLGSCSIRAGILMDQPTLPRIYFPSFCAIDKSTEKVYFAEEALNENIRKNCRLVFPLSPADKVAKLTMDTTCLPSIINNILKQLNVNRTHLTDYHVQVCLPQTYSLSTQSAIAKLFLEDLGVKGLNITHQAICSLYAYNTTSGIVVDMGNRLDILPITDGYIVDAGVSRLPNGDQKIVHNLAQELAQKRVSLFNPLDVYLLRHVFQELCYVAKDYMSEMQAYHANPRSFQKSLRLQGLSMMGSDPVIELDQARFLVPEGLFQPSLWGLDCTGLSKLIAKAVMQSSIDMRKQMAKSVYLSGGLTLLPGLKERIVSDVSKLIPAALHVEVHASPYRKHMAFIGACTMASTGAFDRQCVTFRQWNANPEDCYKFWHIG